MIFHPRMFLLALLLLVSGPAWAQKTEVQLYEDGDYEAAVQLCQQELADAQRSSAQQAQTLVYLAASLHAQGQVEEARKQLEILAREHPEQQVDPVRFPPELVELAKVIHQRAEAEKEFAVREAQLQREREEALRRTPPTVPLYMRPEALGLFEAVDRQWTLGGGVAFRRESLEGSLRALIGNPPAFHLQGGFVPGHGAWRPFLGLRASLVPGLKSYGAGPVVGARIALPGSWVGLVDLGGDYFFAGRDDRYRFAVTAQAGLGFDLRLQ
ncbi:MAG: tetratricopeptide repeat protein [Hyalangium sp.]|uniref:tetratricopeptide repeat protein n=1 Tax=Hyalangium sp. TaxID=2028555 RepID=UPI00389A764E